MAYTDIASVQQFISQQQLLIWSQPSREDAVAPDKEKIQVAINEAEAEINSHMTKAKYVVPITGASVANMADIKGIANRLTIYNLCEANILGDAGTLERLETMYNRIQAKLTGYADSTLDIVGATHWYNQTNSPMVVGVNSHRNRLY